MHFWVYILANRRGGALYVGVTNDLVRRAFEHREGLVPGFTKRYGIKMLVYYEHSCRPCELRRTRARRRVAILNLSALERLIGSGLYCH